MIDSIIAGVTSLIGGDSATRSADKQNKLNYDRQKEFAKNSIQWRVQDAQAAGISPLAAMGGPTMSYQSSVGGDPMADAMANAGQHFGRAAKAYMSSEERAVNEQSNALKLEHMSLQNDLLRSQITSINNSSNPPFPVMGSEVPHGQGELSQVRMIPPQREISPSGKASQSLGTIPDVGWTQTPTGLSPVPSKDVKERIEDQAVPETMWAIRNQLMPNIREFQNLPHNKPPNNLLPKGAIDWSWSFLNQEYQPVYKKQKYHWRDLRRWLPEKGGK